MKITLIILMALLFSACQESSNETTNTTTVVIETESPQKIEMQLNKTYTLKKGDRLVSITENPVVKIIKKAQDDRTDVILLEGEAEIIVAK